MPIDPKDLNNQDMATKLGLNPDDQSQLQGYTNYLDTDQRAKLRDMLMQRQADQGKAVEIASRGMFQNRTPEEQEFLDKQLSPGMQGLIGGGGMMGGVQPIEKAVAPVAAEAIQAAKNAPSAIEQYLQKMAANQRPGGYAQRLGAAAKGASGLSTEAGQTLTGVTGGNMQDAIIKQQLANKLRGL